MTPDERAAIEARHMPFDRHRADGSVSHQSCLEDEQRWPCDARRLLDALAATEAQRDSAYRAADRRQMLIDAAEADNATLSATLAEVVEALEATQRMDMTKPPPYASDIRAALAKAKEALR